MDSGDWSSVNQLIGQSLDGEDMADEGLRRRRLLEIAKLFQYPATEARLIGVAEAIGAGDPAGLIGKHFTAFQQWALAYMDTLKKEDLEPFVSSNKEEVFLPAQAKIRSVLYDGTDVRSMIDLTK